MLSATAVAIDLILVELGAEQHPLFFFVYKGKLKRQAGAGERLWVSDGKV